MAGRTAALIGMLLGSPAGAEPIALSVAHPRDRVDVGESDVTSIQPRRTQWTPTIASWSVDVCLSVRARANVCRLSTAVVGEAVDVIVGCEVVAKPMVQTPLCSDPCFSITAENAREAAQVARRLREGMIRGTCPMLGS